MIFGHRGAPGYPRYGENTKASFRKALEGGAGGIEFDVRRCGDGRLAVIHDHTVDRTTNGRGAVRKFSYDELRQFDAGFGECVPLLSDVLDEFGARCLLNIELKDAGIAEDVKRLVLERRLEHQVIVSAFDWQELRPLASAVPIALLSSRMEHLIEAAKAFGACAIHPRQELVSQSLITAAHEVNLRVHAWTVNDAADASRLQSLGIDGIFTDFPERFGGSFYPPGADRDL